MDTSEVGVRQAAFYYLKIMQLAPPQGQRCCKGFSSFLCRCFFSHGAYERGEFASTELVIGHWD